jgi:hypothetical protein
MRLMRIDEDSNQMRWKRASWLCRGFLTLLVTIGLPSAALAHPGAAIALGRDGRVYFVDTGGGIFEIGRDGRLNRHDGPAFHWFALDPDSRLAKTAWPSIPGSEIRSVGLHPTLVLSSDFPVTVGRDGALYYPERDPENLWRIIRVSPTGSRSVHATLPADVKPEGDFGWINGLAAGRDGTLYYTHQRVLRKISERGLVSTVAADVRVPDCVPIPGIGPEARPYLRGLDVAPDGTLFVAAAGCGAVLKITPTGQVTPILRTASPYSPTAVAVSDGEVYVLEYLHTDSDNRREWLPRVRKLRRDGTVVVLANVKR